MPISKNLLRLAVGILTALPLLVNAGVTFDPKHTARDVLKQSEKHPASVHVAQHLVAFAEKHNLPQKVLEVGPPEARVKRLFVGLNVHDKALYEDYMKWFNLESSAREGLGGVLPIEFAYEIEKGGYVSGILRPRPDPNAQIYMFGRADVTRDQWFWHSLFHPLARERDIPVLGYSHLIGLTDNEKVNVWRYLNNPNERGPCKSDNCVAWMANIELGETAANSTQEKRRHLFNELEIARTIAHFEMGRRLMLAANSKHTAVMVFLNGEKGIQAFNERLEELLPYDPSTAYADVIKWAKFPEGADMTQAMTYVPDGARVFTPIGAGASPSGLAGLINRAAALQRGIDVDVFVNGMSESALQTGLGTGDGKLRMDALFLGGNMRKLHREGHVGVIPGNLADFPRWMREGKERFKYGAILVRVSPPDHEGHFSLGPNYDMIKTVIDTNPGIKIIAEVNPNIPFTTGDNYLVAEQITAQFRSKSALSGPAVVPFTNIEAMIGKNLGKLVNTGATIQIGIGNVFAGLPGALKENGVKNLRFSTEMLGDVAKEMLESGVADSAETGFAFGSPDLYNYLNRNPKVVFRSTEHTNSPARVSSIDGFTAINTALQVNLLGDVNAEIGPQGRISSPGGQVEFMFGASKAKHGKAIIAIRSTAKQGAISSIQTDFYSGNTTTTHENVTHVVTEYGVADLAGKSTVERAIALINVAHPKFRLDLFNQAIERKILREKHRAEIHFDVAPVEAG
jgi:acyl-CoA hydrolase